MSDTQKTWIGFLFVFLLGCILFSLHGKSGLTQDGTDFTLYAAFDKSDGLMNGADVRMAGLKVGHVVSQHFTDGYRIKVELALDKKYALPVDSSVTIETDGILGAKHIEIVPGADEEIMESGDTFGYTQDVLILNDLLEKMTSYLRSKKENSDEKESD
ncbi:MAG: MCE family protein [Alphaproteobacteria bacterium]|nr:MCE family protein [Alphaproteobacteria bacterium]